MSKPHRSERAKAPTKTAAASAELSPPASEPDPPQRHPFFLLASAIAMALWLGFLLWMALR